MTIWNVIGWAGLVVLLYAVAVIVPWRVGMGSFFVANMILGASIVFTAAVYGLIALAVGQ